MGKMIEVQIPLVVGSNGKWSAYGYDSIADPINDSDWGLMSENLDDSGPEDRDPVWPDAEHRFIIRARVEVPDVPTVQATTEKID